MEKSPEDEVALYSYGSKFRQIPVLYKTKKLYAIRKKDRSSKSFNIAPDGLLFSIGRSFQKLGAVTGKNYVAITFQVCSRNL